VLTLFLKDALSRDAVLLRRRRRKKKKKEKKLEAGQWRGEIGKAIIKT